MGASEGHGVLQVMRGAGAPGQGGGGWEGESQASLGVTKVLRGPRGSEGFGGPEGPGVLTLGPIFPPCRKTSMEIDQNAQKRIQQVINQGGREIKRVAPKFIKGAIDEFYKTSFRLFGQFRKKKYAQIKRKLNRIFNKKP